MFAVMGATGQVGRAVADTLIDRRLAVRVIVRSASKARDWAVRGADVAVAAIEDPRAMVDALSGVEGAFVMLPPIFDPSPGFPEAKAVIAALHTALISAAPRKVVALSTIGAAAPQPNLLNQLGLMETAFEDLPMPLAFLRAAWFMENAAGDVADARERGVITSYLQPLDKAFPMVATGDVGATAADLLLEDWRGHRTVEVEGPARVSPNDLAQAFGQALGRPVSVKASPRDEWEAVFRAQGMSNPAPRASRPDGRRFQRTLDRIQRRRRQCPPRPDFPRPGDRRPYSQDAGAHPNSGGLDMAKVFITGSSDGLGLMAARILIQQGHRVVLHGRNPVRAQAALIAAPGAEHAVIGDLAEVEETRRVADQVNALGRFDAVIHNAGVGYREPRRIDTPSGASHVFAVHVLAPYILTALIERPDRLVYISSGMHHGVRPRLDDMLWTKRRWEGASAYAESKFYDVALALAVARLWPQVVSNALEPGWVPTRMGGPGAPDDMRKAPVTQAWLAVSDDKLAQSTGGYFFHQTLRDPNPAASDPKVQDALLETCGRFSGVRLGRLQF